MTTETKSTKKYELTSETVVTPSGRTLHRIKALRDFGAVRAGDLGGFVESEKNLSHEGLCWVYGNAWVSENARVYGDARVYGNALVYKNSRVSEKARVYGYARVS